MSNMAYMKGIVAMNVYGERGRHSPFFPHIAAFRRAWNNVVRSQFNASPLISRPSSTPHAVRPRGIQVFTNASP